MIISDIIEYKDHYIVTEFSNDSKNICVLLVYTNTKPSTIVYEYMGIEQGTQNMLLYGAHSIQVEKAKEIIDNLIKTKQNAL